MFQPKPTRVRHHKKLSETSDGVGNLLNEGSIFLFDLEVGFAGEAAVKDTSNWVFVYLKNMGEFEDECAGFVLFEVKATSEGVQARDCDGLIGLGEEEILEL